VRVLRTAAENVSGLVPRREHALSVIERVLDLPYKELKPSDDWNSLPVGSYLISRPFCLYFEPAFTEYHRHLENLYGNDLSLFAADFRSCGHDLWKAIRVAERIALEIESEDLAKFDPYTATTQYLHQWYLRLIEQAFDSLLGFAVYRLQTNSGKQPPSQPWNIYEAIKKHGWNAPGEFYHPTVRNGIAHEFEFIPETVFSPFSVIYTDIRGKTQTVSYSDLIHEVTGMADECLGYVFALRLFILEHSNNRHVRHTLAATSSNRSLRVDGFRDFASSRSLIVQSVNVDDVNGKKQTRIECLDYTRVDPERLAEMVAMLSTASIWFPDCDTFFVGLKSKGTPSFSRIDASVLASWVRDEVDDHTLLQSFDPIMMWPKKVFLGRLKANLVRTIPSALKAGRDEFKQTMAELPGRLPRTVRVLSLTDISHGLARRYRGDLVIDAEDQATVRKLLRPIIEWTRRQHIHSSPHSKKHWRKTPPVYIAWFLYSREKRERDRGAIPTSEFYIGQFEWRGADADPDDLPFPIRDAEDLGEGLAYKAAPDWPPTDRFVPR